MTTKPYLDFYSQHNVSPVLNKVDEGFLLKRAALYQRLGVVPAFLEGKKVLEFGPGNGINSLYTNSLKPKQYVLVDANDVGLQNCKKNFEKSFTEINNVQFKKSLIEEFKSDTLFDLVICEGLIPHQHHPIDFARNVAQFTTMGGLLILTCHDFISNLSDNLRSFISHLSLKDGMEFEGKIDFLSQFLHSHFTQLKSMNRSHRDWIIDNVLYVDYWKSSPWFSISDAIDACGDQFVIHGCSPYFWNDWRWYKDTVENGKLLFNEFIKEKYYKNLHNFLDYRFVTAERDADKNKALYQKAKEVRFHISQYVDHKNSTSISKIISLLEEIQKEIQLSLPETALSIQCYIKNLENVIGNRPVKFTHFNKWWGKGMQFLSLIRIK